jgi:hypothetical protein
MERRKQKQNNGHDIDLIGYVDIPLTKIIGNQFIEQWYSVQTQFGKEKQQKSQDGLFNIRIKAKYQAIQILPIQSYLHLQEVRHILQIKKKIIDLFYFSIFIEIIFDLLEYLNHILI